MRKISTRIEYWAGRPGVRRGGLGGRFRSGGQPLGSKQNQNPGDAANVPVDETPVPRAAGPYTSFAPIVKKVAPGVVKIVVTTKAANVVGAGRLWLQ